MRQTFGSNWYDQTAHLTDRTRRISDQICNVPHQTGITRTWKGRNRQNVLHELYKACTARVVIAIRICSKKRRSAILLYWPQKSELHDHQRRQPNSADRRISGLDRRNAHILNVWHQFWILANRDGRPGQGKIIFHIAPWNVQIFYECFSVWKTHWVRSYASYIIPLTFKWQFAIVYLDDVFIFSRSLEEHLDHLWLYSNYFRDPAYHWN